MTSSLLLLFGGRDKAYAEPANVSAPVVSGINVPTAVLSCSNGSWTGGGLTYTYQWRNGGGDISGETANTYTVVSGDIGDVIDCVVTATNTFGAVSEDSNDLTIVALDAPVNTVAPAITGSGIVGETLTCSTGTWTGYFITYSYQWKRGASDISGATASTYIAQNADLDEAITCVVTATNATASVDQPTTEIYVIAVPVNTVAPAVTGDAVFGSLLSCGTGTWTGGGTITYAYQWRLDGVAISGATSATYTTLEAQVGSAVDCVVTASNEAGTGTGVDSNDFTVTAVEALYDFTGATLDDATFTRASSGTRFNSSGVLVSETTDAARFDYDPVTLALKGLLIEPQATNLIHPATASSDWNGSGSTTGYTITTNQAVSPSGTTNASLLKDTVVNTGHNIEPPNDNNITSVGTRYYFSTTAKKKDQKIFQVAGAFSGQFGTTKYINCDLDSGEITASGADATMNTMTNFGNGWYRCDTSFVSAATGTSPLLNIALVNDQPLAAKVPSYVGAATGLYVSYSQVTTTPFTSLIITTTSAATRAADVLTLTIPADVTDIRFTFDDNSTQDVDVSAYSGSTYVVPTNLNRAWIKTVTDIT